MVPNSSRSANTFFRTRRFEAYLHEGASVYFEMEGEFQEFLAEIGDTLVHGQTEFPVP